MFNKNNQKNFVLTKKGILIKKHDITFIEHLKIICDLTYISKNNSDYGKIFLVKNFEEYNDKIIIPKFYGLKKFKNINKTDIVKLDIDKINIEFKGKLRDYQIEIINNIKKHYFNENGDLKQIGGGIINIPPGKGKTVIALYLSTLIKYKTLIVVHKTFLLEQWKERIQQYTNAKIGIVHRNIVDIENKDIVIAMLHSLCLKDYEDIYDGFEFVIFDESHHLGANMFSKIFKKINASFTLGLSATPFRLDGMQKVFYDNIGDIMYSEEDNRGNNVNINLIKFWSNDKKKFKMITNKRTQNPIHAIMITNISQIESRTKLIANKIVDIINNCENRKILVLSSRLEQLTEIEHYIVEDDSKFKNFIGYYTGRTNKKNRKIAEDKNIILASYEIASEGLDIKGLNTLVLATPLKGSKEQIFGRIMRSDNFDNNPMIVDIIDDLGHIYFSGKQRYNHYVKKKYAIFFENYNDLNLINNENFYKKNN